VVDRLTPAINTDESTVWPEEQLASVLRLLAASAALVAPVVLIVALVAAAATAGTARAAVGVLPLASATYPPPPAPPFYITCTLGVDSLGFPEVISCEKHSSRKATRRVRRLLGEVAIGGRRP
jgi:hypothetical protein